MKMRFAAALFALSFPLLAQDPAASEALFYKAYWLQNGERNFAEAMSLYDKFLQQAPDHALVPRAAQFQFELLTRAGKTDEAKAFAQKYEKQLGKVAVPAPAAQKPAEGSTRPARQEGGDNAQRIADLKKQLEEAKASGDEEAAARLQRQIARLEQGGGEPGQGGPGGAAGGRGMRGGMFGTKKLADMTPEELEQAKGGLERMSGMVERMKEANPEGAKAMEDNLAALKTALDANNLEEAQKVIDKIRESMPQRGGRGGQGGPGGRGRGEGGGGGGGNGGGGGGN